MSGPVRTEDAAPDPVGEASADRPTVEVTESREATVGSGRVRRALPHRPRRTVGAWCFVDHMGPQTVTGPDEVGIGPHPHIGLQTITWLHAGELRHLDTLGSDQVIRPGQLNLMTAGHGVAHAEEATEHWGRFEGMQLWVALPEATRHGPPAFEHHAELPQVELDHGVGTVVLGAIAGATSPARADTDHVGLDLDLRPGAVSVPVRPDHEHALVVAEGAVEVDGVVVAPGHLAYLGLGRDELGLVAREPTRLLLIGGTPFEAEVSMWWNFVARTHDEITSAAADWNADTDRFGEIGSRLDRIPAPPVPWTR